jgi:hypothetical protein
MANIELTDKAREMLAKASLEHGENPSVRLYQAGMG